MATQVHKIGRQYLNIEFNGSEPEAMALQGSFSGMYMHSIAPAIEQVLDRCSNPESVVRIDRLEIDAGAVGLDNIERMLPEMVADALEKALHEILDANSELSGMETGSTVRHMSEEENSLDALLFFLKNGTLPWSFRPGSISAFDSLLMKALGKTAFTEGGRPFIESAIRLALSTPVARKRLIAQFSPPFVESLLERLLPGANALLNVVVLQIRISGARPEVIAKVGDAFLEHAFACAASGRGVTKEALLKEIETLTMPLTRAETAQEQRNRPDKEAGPEYSEKHREKTSARNRQDQNMTSTKPPSEAPGQKTEDSENKTDSPSSENPEFGDRSVVPPSPTLEQNAENQFADRTEAHRQSDKSSHSGPERAAGPDPGLTDEHPDRRSGIYVEHAGLVLLHPFLPQLFRALGIAGDDTLLMPERALRLLHFLATGEDQAAEYDLVFPKILCGLPTGALCGKPSGLTTEERDEAYALLSAVVRHWEALKNTGPEGLRETYIKRPGKLSRRSDGDWLLQVESKSFDILLDRLPWAVSMIRLPWMGRMLHVEWYY
ncbi:MAG TPA: contractile injection system tape measure protein [Chlorobaculum sp.]|nr:contractile injection system tape measure protein [Chlorobaculum sp.]